MTPHKKGRFCSHCQKCVIDFRPMQANEIKSYLNKNPDSCGVFNHDQLNEVNALPSYTIPLPTFMRFVPLGILSMIGIHSQAQENPNSKNHNEIVVTETEIISLPSCEEREADVVSTSNSEIILGKTLAQKPEENVKDTIIPLQKITGTVIDIDGFPVSDAIVSIPSREQSTITDLDGNFEIEGNIGDIILIEDQYLGYKDMAVEKENLGTIYFGSTITEGIIIIKRKFPNNIIYKMGFPIRKVRQWIRGY